MAKPNSSFVKKLQSLTENDYNDAEDFFNKQLETSQRSDGDAREKKNQKSSQKNVPEEKEGWLEDENYEGQLAVDVFQTPKNIIIQSTIAGVRPEDLDISFTNDTITIRGTRKKSTQTPPEDYFYSECYWGGFSRSIILPVDVKEDKIDAKMENGILTIVIPKSQKPSSKHIPVKEILS